MRTFRTPKLALGALVVFALVYALSFTPLINGYILHIINLSLIYVILAVSLNLINGIAGQFSLGHMGFAAVGAYVSGTVTTLIFHLKPTEAAGYPIFVLALVAGGLAAGLVGFLIGFPSLRLKGDYLAIVTLGFGEIIRTALNNIEVVGGPRGLLGIPKFSSFPVIALAALLTVVVVRNLVESPAGRSMLAVRENELAAELVGVDTTRYKVMAFVVGAGFAGVAGGLMGHLLQLAHPTQFGFQGSVLVLIMIYVGGVGSLTGSVIAAFSLTFISEGLRSLLDFLAFVTKLPIGGEWRMVVFSALLIVVMLFKTEGLMGTRELRFMILEAEEAVIAERAPKKKGKGGEA